MARYIDADKLCKELSDMALYQDPYKQSTILGVVGTIKNTRTADVAPRAEVAREIFALIFDELLSSFPAQSFVDAPCTTHNRLFAMLDKIQKKYTEEQKCKRD